MPDTLLIRADASTQIGTGHVMRCLALAQEWKRNGGRVVFVHAQTTNSITERLRVAGMDTAPISTAAANIEDAQATASLAQNYAAAWVVADGYAFGASWQETVKGAGYRLLLIDDYGHAEHYCADVILNQNASATTSLYARRSPTTRLLLGTCYTLLRDEFCSLRALQRTTRDLASRVLVTLGGSDPDNVTTKILDALTDRSGLELVVAVGGSNPHLSEIKAAAARQKSEVRVVFDAANMPELMAWADVAISAAGSTCWELAHLGLPALLVTVAENQIPIAATLDRTGIGLNLGPHTSLTQERIGDSLYSLLGNAQRRRSMSEQGRDLIDGHGVRRVAAVFKKGLQLSIVSDPQSWLNEAIAKLKCEFEHAGHQVSWHHDPAQLREGDIAFFLSLSRIVPPTTLRCNAHNLVVHESALPQGRGWSPLTWQILEGKNQICVSLVEAADAVDSGVVYAREKLHFAGHELIDELRAAQAAATVHLCQQFVTRYPEICAAGQPQTGDVSFYPRRRPEDSRLDLDKSLREQFNLLRVADPDRYPAFFEISGRRYSVKIQPTAGATHE